MNMDQSRIHNPKSKILWLVIPSLVLLVVLAFDLLPLLRGNDEWLWPLRPFETTLRFLIPIVTLGLYVVFAARWLKCFEKDVSRRVERWFLLYVILAAPLIQLALASAVSPVPLLEFFGPTVSVHNSGYFTTAVSTPDLRQLLSAYPQAMPALPIHAQSHPPAPIIAHWLSWQGLQAAPSLADAVAMPLRTLQCHNPGLMALDNAQIASASLGMLLPLIGGWAVWPLYALAKRMTTARAAAITALVFPVLPLFALWMSQWDQIYPLLLFLGFYLAHTGLEKNSWWRVFAAGVPLSIASFFSVGNFVLMFVVGLYGLVWLWFQRASLRPSISQSLRLAITFALGCASIWLLYWLLYWRQSARCDFYRLAPCLRIDNGQSIVRRVAARQPDRLSSLSGFPDCALAAVQSCQARAVPEIFAANRDCHIRHADFVVVVWHRARRGWAPVDVFWAAAGADRGGLAGCRKQEARGRTAGRRQRDLTTLCSSLCWPRNFWL